MSFYQYKKYLHWSNVSKNKTNHNWYYIHKTPNQTRFFGQIITEFKPLQKKCPFLITTASIILTLPRWLWLWLDFIDRLESVIHVVVPIKTIRIKNNTNEWLNGLMKKLQGKSTHKLKFQMFQINKNAHVDENRFKEATNSFQNLIRKKEKILFWGNKKSYNHSQNIWNKL